MPKLYPVNVPCFETEILLNQGSLLLDANRSIGSNTYTTVAALADINPATGIKFGDVWEIDHACGAPLIDAENTRYT